MKHNWRRREDGEIDDFGFEVGFHNGPMCSDCYESFCEHCVKDKQAELDKDDCTGPPPPPPKMISEADHLAALKATEQAALLRGVQEALVLHMTRTDITIKEESARIVASLKEG